MSEALPTGRSSRHGLDYTPATSIDPTHLQLNLRILAFIEACRTIPLEYPPVTDSALPSSPSGSGSSSTETQQLHNPDDKDAQMALLLKAQKLYSVASALPKFSDRAIYIKELENVGGLLAYKVPEQSAMARYLSQDRREAVADQINRAILSEDSVKRQMI